MINNIVETNRPAFERPAHADTKPATSAAPSTSSAGAAVSSEDHTIIGRKLEYGFTSLRQENAALRKQLEEVAGAIKLIRGDIDMLRTTIARGASNSHAHQNQQAAPTQAQSATTGAPQYRKTEADEAYERGQGGSASESNAAPAGQQARGFAKKEETTVDISKVFYYGKK
jgi:hypothetical protein